jgi:hypothetical protein
MVDFTINDGPSKEWHLKWWILHDFTIQTGDAQEQLTDKEEVRQRSRSFGKSWALGILLMDTYSKWNPYRIL